MASFVSMREYLKLKDKVGELEARLQALEGHGAAVYEEATKSGPEAPEIPSIENAVEEKDLFDLLDAPVANKLIGKGYMDINSIREASDEDLQSISGIGEATVKKIREALEGS